MRRFAVLVGALALVACGGTTGEPDGKSTGGTITSRGGAPLGGSSSGGTGVATGGEATGGRAASGGTTTGGAQVSGGTSGGPASGGLVAMTGGSASGGVITGGATTSGGTSSGGAIATGGSSNTGGVEPGTGGAESSAGESGIGQGGESGGAGGGADPSTGGSATGGAPACECTTGECCDGCHVRPSSYFCGEATRASSCGSQQQYIDFGNLFCDGHSAGRCIRFAKVGSATRTGELTVPYCSGSGNCEQFCDGAGLVCRPNEVCVDGDLCGVSPRCQP